MANTNREKERKHAARVVENRSFHEERVGAYAMAQPSKSKKAVASKNAETKRRTNAIKLTPETW